MSHRNTLRETIEHRISAMGYTLCSSCRDVLRRIDDNDNDWVYKHKRQIARILNANLRKGGKIPLSIRVRWIERQIERAIAKAEKESTCTHLINPERSTTR